MYGLLDLQQALTWVRAEIEAFGGDPDRVTVAGESAGGLNVVTLLLSPRSEGLFHRAVSMSPAGSLIAQSDGGRPRPGLRAPRRGPPRDGLAEDAAEARALVEERGPDFVSTYLRGLSPERILGLTTPLSALGFNEMGLTVGALGSGRFEDGTVIPLGSGDGFSEGRDRRVPLMIGSNTEEWKTLEIALGLLITLDARELVELVRGFDPDGPPVALDPILPSARQDLYETVGSVAGVLMFRGTGVDPVASAVARHRDVHVYEFAWRDQPAPFDVLVGAGHMMELPFFFGNFQTDSRSLFRFAWSDANRDRRDALSAQMVGYLADFLHTGDPNGDGSAGRPRWEPWTAAGGARRLTLGE